jgi:glycosyltransferase 2 family protein
MNKKQALKFGRFLVRWGIAVIGIWWVISKMSWHDHVWALLPGQNMPTKDLTLTDWAADESSGVYHVILSGQPVVLLHDEVINQPDRDNLREFGNGKVIYVVGVDLSPDLKQARRLLVADHADGPVARWEPASDFPNYQITVPHPRVQIGVRRMLREANTKYILAALAIFPLTILITSLRWHELLKALDVRLTVGRTFVLNMVGLFYNTIMPLGSTGGDLLKAYYVRKQTHHGTRAVMSVAVDRVIGLLALIVLGGTMATMQRHIPRCRQVPIASAGLIALTALAMIVFYVPTLRRRSGLEFILKRLPLQKQVGNAIETMHIYAGRPWLVLGALIVSFPVHMVVITAAQMCGIAFGLHLSTLYYWMAVPVIVLASAIPISPQGAGVMEYFAIKLLEPQGVTVGQAFALTMSIRLTQIFWNLTGGIFVLRGGYHKPSQIEQKQAEEEEEEEEKSEVRIPNDEPSRCAETRNPNDE